MKYLKKLIIPVVIVLVLIVSIITRGIINTDKVADGDLVFWAKNDGNVVQQDIYEKAIKKFHDYYPECNVVIKQYDDYSKIYNDVLLNTGTNTTPNVCISYPDHVATYLKNNGSILDLSKYINDKDYGFGGSKVKFKTSSNNINVTYLKEGYINDNLYLLPFMRSSEATYVNLDYLESLGYECPDVLTWDFMWEVCQKARSLNSNQDFWPMIYKSEDNMIIQLLYQNNYPYTTNNSEILFVNKKTTNLLMDLSKKAKNKYYSTFSKSGYPGNFFNRGNCIFAIDSTAGSTWMGSNCPLLDIDKSEVKQFRTKVMNVPQISIENQKMISQGPSLCIFDKGDEQTNLAAWLFAQFLLSDEVQLSYCKTEGYLPVTYSAINSTEFKNYLKDETEYDVKREATELIMKNVNNMFITPVFDGSTNVRNAAKYLGRAVVSINYDTEEKLEGLYTKVINNYGLDDMVKTNYIATKKQNITLPLFLGLGLVWFAIAGYIIFEKYKNKKQ